MAYAKDATMTILAQSKRKEMNAEELHKELREFIGENGHKTIIQYMILRDGKIVKEGSDK